MDFFNPQKFLLGGIKKEIVDAMHDTPTYFTYLASTSSKTDMYTRNSIGRHHEKTGWV